jgi:hypothetical protein
MTHPLLLLLLLLLLLGPCWRRTPCAPPLPTLLLLLLLLLLMRRCLPLLVTPRLLPPLRLQVLLLLLNTPCCPTPSASPLLRPTGLAQHGCCVAICPCGSSQGSSSCFAVLGPVLGSSSSLSSSFGCFDVDGAVQVLLVGGF